MPRYWFLTGEHAAPGWNALRKDYKDEEIEIVHLDPNVWAMIEADDSPEGYDGLTSKAPVDGLYLDPQGNALYMVDGGVVTTAEEVVVALGDEAKTMLEKIGDPHTVLQRMGRSF
jgi:hypothetical protein